MSFHENATISKRHAEWSRANNDRNDGIDPEYVSDGNLQSGGEGKKKKKLF